MKLHDSFKLNTGHTIPAVGLGTWQAEPGLVEAAVAHAIQIGYRHIDCAAIYGQEQEVGKGIKKGGVPREQLFITSKLWNTRHDPKDVAGAFEKTLKDLDLDYLDLYLMHTPVAFKSHLNVAFENVTMDMVDNIDFCDTWKAMGELLATGKVRSIGVSNFNITNMERLLSNTKNVPAVNQIELHPYLPQDELVKFCQSKNIHVTAYSPLGSAGAPLQSEPIINEVAKKHQCTPAQVLINWAVARNTSVIPKSVDSARIESNFAENPLNQNDIDKIAQITKRERYCKFLPWGKTIFD
ncbi:NADP-dependent oxidoreductase domain-containing protein [Syncephalis fuscata]|nr:NADP-dependent oxidoreductase domain-containing protein [Syncephalis fuscata]